MTDTPDPSTGAGFDAVEVDTQDYFDPNATDDQWPGVVGLQMRRHHWWQGDVEFDTFDTLGPTGDSVQVDVSGNADDGSTQNPTVIIQPVPTFTPLIGVREYAISIELHGCYGFPDAGGDSDPTLSYNTVCKIPVLPEVINPTFPSNNHWSVQLVGGGEVVVPGNEMLESVTIKSFWPAEYDDSFVGISQDDFTAQGAPEQVMANLIWTKRWSIPIRLVIGGGIFTDYVIITDFDYSHTHGTLTDYDYTIGLKRLKSTSIVSVANPDADTDHFSTIPLTSQTTVGQQPTPVATTDTTSQSAVQSRVAGGEFNVGQAKLPVDVPLVVAPETVFPDVDTAKSAQSEGLVKNPVIPVVVGPSTDNSIIPDFFGGGDTGTGQTLNQVAAANGVKWDDTQKALNPQYAYTDPNAHLTAGVTLNIALPTPTGGSKVKTLNPGEQFGVPPSDTVHSIGR